MELIFAYGAGLLTLINPCVLPVLPIVLGSALQAGRHGPLFLALGMALSFVTLGMLVSTVGVGLGITEETVSTAAAILMIGFGLILLVPRFSEGFATATAGMSARAGAGIDTLDQRGASGQFLGGVLLGAVWSPCIGPTLGGAIALASQGESLFRAGAIMVAFAIGVITVMLALAYGARAAILRRQAAMRAIAGKARAVMGGLFVFVGVAILMKWHHMAEIWALDTLPPWLIDFSVSL